MSIAPDKTVASGDKCPKRGCSGRLEVVQTIVKADHRVRYLGCDVCGHRPQRNKVIVPIQYAPKRNGFKRWAARP